MTKNLRWNFWAGRKKSNRVKFHLTIRRDLMMLLSEYIYSTCIHFVSNKNSLLFRLLNAHFVSISTSHHITIYSCLFASMKKCKNSLNKSHEKGTQQQPKTIHSLRKQRTIMKRLLWFWDGIHHDMLKIVISFSIQHFLHCHTPVLLSSVLINKRKCYLLSIVGM